ncbi:hypothetical protein Tco_0567634 [Tanacetum coccineum]
MSDSEHSTITYTSVSIPVEDDSDMGSPGVDGPPSPIRPGPLEPGAGTTLTCLFTLCTGAVHPGVYTTRVNDDVFPAEESRCLPPTSPTADSPGLFPESDPERDPEEDDEEDHEEDPADYPADKRDDDDDDDDDDEEEDEEHLAHADYTVVALPAVDHIPSPNINCLPSPPPNIPTHIEVPESCLPLRKRLRCAAPTPNHKVGESSAVGAARQDGLAVAREDPYSIARGDLYGFIDRVYVAPERAIEEIAPTTLEGVNQRVTNLSTTVEHETTIMYGMMEDAQDDRSLLRARVKLLYRDRPIYRRLAVMIERERMAREAWGLSMDASDYACSDVMSLHTTIVGQHALISELQSADHRRQGVIKELWAADHQRQVQLTKALKLLKGLQN